MPLKMWIVNVSVCDMSIGDPLRSYTLRAQRLQGATPSEHVLWRGWRDCIIVLRQGQSPTAGQFRAVELFLSWSRYLSVITDFAHNEIHLVVLCRASAAHARDYYFLMGLLSVPSPEDR